MKRQHLSTNKPATRIYAAQSTPLPSLQIGTYVSTLLACFVLNGSTNAAPYGSVSFLAFWIGYGSIHLAFALPMLIFAPGNHTAIVQGIIECPGVTKPPPVFYVAAEQTIVAPTVQAFLMTI